MGFTGQPPIGAAWGSGTVVEVEGTVLVEGVVVVGPVLEGVGTVVVLAPGTVLEVAPATGVVVATGADVDDVVVASVVGVIVVVSPATVVVVSPATVVVVVVLATVVVVVVLATAVDVELSGTGSAECADVEVEAITTNATSGAITPTDRTRVRTVGNTAAP